ncbi:MAG: hypothetical protein H6553_00995 [Chitinophagales bacterium]|nr:hypothetical protein [Chitinophagales bacterium]
MELDFTLLFTKKLYNEITDKENSLLQEALTNNKALQAEFNAFQKVFNQIKASKLEGKPNEKTIQNILKYTTTAEAIHKV